MFKTAATKLAHSSAIPTLAGNPDLKPLQEIITTEKFVLQSLQRLSVDFSKSSEALQSWAKSEGDDLEDTFSACSDLLGHWIESLASFASHIAHIRECVKTVRTKEEALDNMQRRRRSLGSRADSTEKKLNKMGVDSKNVRQRTDELTGLREHIRALDSEIMVEEASLGDWKRLKAREWMGVLLGSLFECSEKGSIVARFGRSIIGHLSTEKTQPGHPRAIYSGYTQVGSLVGEAEHELSKVSFSTEVGDNDQPQFNAVDEHPTNDRQSLRPPSYSSPLVSPTAMHLPQHYAPFALPSSPPRNPSDPNEFGQYSPRRRHQLHTPRQQSDSPLPNRLSPTSTAQSRLSPSPQEGSGFSPGHTRIISRSSASSGIGSVSSDASLPPLPPLPRIPQTHPKTPEPESE